MQVDADTELAKAYLELKRQYDDLVSRNLAGVFRTTIDGRFLECNDAMAIILGFADREELLSDSAHELYHTPEERDHFIRKLLTERKLINFEIRLKHSSGPTPRMYCASETPSRAASARRTARSSSSATMVVRCTMM